MLRIFLVAIFMLPGCTYSAHPIHTKMDVIFDDAFIGTWTTKDLLGVGKVEVSRWAASDDTYRVVVRDESGKHEQGSFQGYLCKIEDKKFVSLKFEGKPSDESDTKSRVSYLTFLMDQQKHDSLQVRYLNQGWLTMYVKSKPEALKHELVSRPSPSDKKDL